MALASTIQVDPSSDDMSTAAQTMLASGVDTIIIAANQVPAATAVRALDAAGSTVPVITSYVNADATWLGGIQDVLANFDVYASAWISIFAEDGVTFSESYDTYVENIDEEYAANAYAFAGWIAAATFVVGLERVGEDTLTWDSYIAAMESEPVELPFGVVVDYADGRRVGTQAMAFLQGEVADEVAAWATEQPIQTIDEILAD
jgi:ABC-type branched-subunit amino acid transport system substrate-binding protein